jgi:glycosyltransferase involved in cell wall biosynthesis
MKRYLLIGNAESPHIIKWAKELVKHFQVHVVSSQDVSPEIKELIPDNRIYAFNLNIAESGGNIQFYKMILPLKKIIKRIKPDFVNAHYITSHGTVAAVAKKFSSHKFPLILSAWGTDILVTPGRNLLYKKITRFALKQAALVTTDSMSVAKVVHELSSTPTTTFPFGLEALPEASSDSKDKNLFFSNRTLNANSNIDRVLHFFARVAEQNKDARLVVANDGPMKEVLIELGKQLGIGDRVKFSGFINPEEQDDYYRKSQYYFSVLSSDALSVSLLEAMAYGCIPLVSDLPDNRDWVTDNENGIIMTEGIRIDVLPAIQEKAAAIFQKNREMITEKAIFPKSIKEFISKLESIETSNK